MDETKEILRQTFIARNLIYPSINLKKRISLSDVDLSELKEEAIALYRSLESLERIHARAIMNYLYTSAIELKLFGQRSIKERVVTEAIGFGLGDWANQLLSGDLVDLVVNLDRDDWGGRSRAVLKIQDLRLKRKVVK